MVKRLRATVIDADATRGRFSDAPRQGRCGGRRRAGGPNDRPVEPNF
jgi:hypothetical protein